ncbi:MAG TPA: hypothetical protein VIL18_01470 [Longimicrobiales bacterium]|jgi:hypothetical protein
MRRSFCLLLGGLFFAAACGGDDPLSPRDLAGVYELVAVDGSSLPYTLETGFECTTGTGAAGVGERVLISGSLSIRPDGFNVFELHFRSSCTPPGHIGEVEEWGQLSNGPVKLSGNRITLLSQFLDQTPREVGAGTVRGDEITVTVTDENWEPYTFTYTFRKTQEEVELSQQPW